MNLDAGIRGSGTTAQGFAHGEVGAHLTQNADLFGYGDASLTLGAPLSWETGVGLRVTW